MFTWAVCVPIAFLLAYATDMPIVPMFLLVQSLELVKSVIGFVLMKKGVWVRNIIADNPAGEAVC